MWVLERVNATYMLVEMLHYVLLMVKFKVCTLGSSWVLYLMIIRFDPNLDFLYITGHDVKIKLEQTNYGLSQQVSNAES